MLTLAMLIIGVGGMNALTLNATFSTPAPNGSWDTEANTYTWTGSTNNLMTIFSFPNGELANYTSIHMTTADLTGEPYRICFMNGSTAVATIAFYSAGQKDINFADREETKDLDMSAITHISFGGNSGSGTVKLTNVYLEGPDPVDPLYHDVFALGSPITFEQAKTSTEPFVLVQNGDVICCFQSPGWPNDYVTFKPVSEIDDYAYTFKFEKDGETDNYFLAIYDQSNNKKGYVNTSVWSHAFMAGDLGDTKGERQNGGLWNFIETSTGSKQYRIKNVGAAGGSYNENGGSDTKCYLKKEPSGYWANHLTVFNTVENASVFEFYTLTTTTLPDLDPVYFGWEDFKVDGGATKDDNNHLVIDTRGYAPYWATSGTWTFTTPFDASNYRYLVFYAKRNISKYGNGDNETGGSLLITDDNGVTMRQDDYDRYGDPVVYYPDVPSGSFWMNRWGNQRAMALDLQWLANTNKYGDGSECKAIDVSKIKQVGVAGTFTIGGIFFTNTLPACSAGDYKRSFDSFDKFGTICLPYNAVCCGAQLYEITGKTANGITLSEYEGVMEAGKAYFYKTIEAKKGDLTSDETEVYFFKAGYTKVADPVANNGLVGTFTETNAPTDSWVLSNNKLYTVNSDVTVGANKAWIVPEDIVSTNTSRGTVFISFDEITGIKAVNETLNAGKIYDLSGREVTKPAKGIYVIDGKKVIIK